MGMIFVAREGKYEGFDNDRPEYFVFSKEPKFRKDGALTQRCLDHFEENFCADFWERITGIVVEPSTYVRVKMTVMRGLKS